MVDFKELKITPEGEFIYDIEIIPEYREIIQLLHVYIDPVDNIKYYTDGWFNERTYSTPCSDTETRGSFTLVDTMWDTMNDMFVVRAAIELKPSPTPIPIPCGMDSSPKIALVVPIHEIYKEGINLLNEVESDCCKPPKKFIDYFLRLKATLIAAENGHIDKAIKFYKKFFKKSKKDSTSKNCVCHERNS